MSMMRFIDRYFIEPVMSSQGYNIYNTLVYATLFLLGIYLTHRFLKKSKIKIGEEFFWSLIPFIILGGVIRALSQYTFVRGDGVLPLSFWFFTPGLYILISFFALVSLGISISLNKNRYFGIMYMLGGIPALLGLAFVLDEAAHYLEFLWIIGSSLGITLLLLGMIVRFWHTLYTKSNSLIISGFVLDATSSSIATAFLGYTPEHVLTKFISTANPFLFIPLKLTLILGALYFIEKESNEEEKWLFKIALIILGLPHGIHDSLQVLMGV